MRFVLGAKPGDHNALFAWMDELESARGCRTVGAEGCAGAARVPEHTDTAMALLYGELLRRRMAKPGALPPVLPLVLYNGDAPWTPETEMRRLIAEPSPLLAPCQPSQSHFVLDQRRARAEDFKLRELTWAVAQLEQSGSAADLARTARQLATLLTGSGESELRRTFAHWLWALRRSLVGADPAPRPPEGSPARAIPSMPVSARQPADVAHPMKGRGRHQTVVRWDSRGRHRSTRP